MYQRNYEKSGKSNLPRSYVQTQEWIPSNLMCSMFLAQGQYVLNFISAVWCIYFHLYDQFSVYSFIFIISLVSIVLSLLSLECLMMNCLVNITLVVFNNENISEKFAPRINNFMKGIQYQVFDFTRLNTLTFMRNS